MNKLIRDPEFENLVPPLSQKERQLLEESILREGCRDAIIIWNDVILDGYNRYDICMKHCLPFQIRHMHMESRDEAIAWICANQMGRRNITEETRRYLIGKRYEAEKRIGAHNITGKNQHSPEELPPRMLGEPLLEDTKHGVAQRIGREYHLSHATVEKYGRYSKAVDRIAGIEPRVVPHILSGAVHIGQDNMVDIGKLSDRQIRAVAASIPYNNEFHLSRDHIINALRNGCQEGSEHTPVDIPQLEVRSVKNMPAFDPDAEVASLTLTIPSWKTSIERVRSTANMQNVSEKAKTSLQSALTSLRKSIDDMFSSIQEE